MRFWGVDVRCLMVTYLLITIRDTVVFGRAGLSLCYLVPIAVLLSWVKASCTKRFVLWVLFFSLVGAALMDQALAVLLLDRPLNFLMIISQISVNVALGSIIFLGMRGNRSSVQEERKVWTPNRTVPYKQIICK